MTNLSDIIEIAAIGAMMLVVVWLMSIVFRFRKKVNDRMAEGESGSVEENADVEDYLQVEGLAGDAALVDARFCIKCGKPIEGDCVSTDVGDYHDPNCPLPAPKSSENPTPESEKDDLPGVLSEGWPLSYLPPLGMGAATPEAIGRARRKREARRRLRSPFSLPPRSMEPILEMVRKPMWDTIHIPPGGGVSEELRFDARLPHRNGQPREIHHEVSDEGCPLPNPRKFLLDRVDLAFEDVGISEESIQTILSTLFIQVFIGVKPYLEVPGTAFIPVGGKDSPVVKPWRLYGHPVEPAVPIRPMQIFWVRVTLKAQVNPIPTSSAVKVFLRGLMGREVM